MGRMKDITGQRFGKLVAIRPTEKRSQSRILWECRCDCGNTVYVVSPSLLNGSTKSCGCEKNSALIRDLTGQRFGKLIAIRPTDERKNKSVVWECRCDCGNTVFVKSTDLLKGGTQSCGCMKKGAPAKNLTGRRFGKLIAIRPTDERKDGSVVWECQCDCGNTVFVPNGHLVKGITTSCGCMKGEKTGKRLVGKRFGMLTVIRPTDERKYGSIVWECRCDCGNTAFVLGSSLVKGRTKSCGCLKRGRAKKETHVISDMEPKAEEALTPAETVNANTDR